jgi:hypothetical protein
MKKEKSIKKEFYQWKENKVYGKLPIVYVCKKCFRVSVRSGYGHATKPHKTDFCDGKFVKRVIW